MFKGNRIGVVITIYNEESLIEEVINTIPSFVDKIYAINDGSSDSTSEILFRLVETNERLVVITHKNNKGVGAGKVSGYKTALKDGMDVTVMMAGDGQTDPAYLSNIITPIAEGQADYSKGTRLSSSRHRKEMYAWRLFGNFLLTWLTRISSGYWHVSDPQNGYAAMSKKTLERLNVDSICSGWPAENDILVKLHVQKARVVDVPHPAIYRGEKSSIKYSHFVLATSWLLLKNFLWRIYREYLKRPSKHKLAGKDKFA